MENEKLNNLLKTQKILVQKGDYQESLNKCCEIIQKIISFPKEKQYEILSSILSQKNQFLYIIFGIYQYLIQNQFILNSDNQTKIKYYELLLKTLKKNKDKSLEFQTDKENLISNLEKENYNIEEIEKIINLISLYPIENNRFNTINNNNSKLYNEEILITNDSKNSGHCKDNKKSFSSIDEWIRQCRSLCSPDTRFFLIGNKNDVEEEK